MLKPILKLGKQSKASLIGLAVALVAVLSLVDYLTGDKLEMALFYTLPVALVAWAISRRAGVLFSALSAVAWMATTSLCAGPMADPALIAGNGLLLFAFFAAISLVLSALSMARRRQDELTRLIIHDLRSPLTISVMSLDVFDESFGEGISGQQRELLDVCRMSYNQMMTLINSILDLARLESGRMPLHRQRVELSPLVETTLQSLRIEAAQKHVRLVTELDSAAGPVFADPMITERILVNLVGNAVKFSPQDDEVTLRCEPGRLGEAAGMLIISVQDHGRGIPPEWIQRVFGPFEQVEADGDHARSGSGLGLAFCRLAVEAQGGRIWIDSQPGHGATIRFTLPVAPEEKPSIQPGGL